MVSNRWLLEGLEALDAKLGSFGLKHVGWELFKLLARRDVPSGREVRRNLVYGLDGMYHHANRGQGDRRVEGVLRFDRACAELERPPRTTAVMEEGILEEAMRTLDQGLGFAARVLPQGRRGVPLRVKSPIVDARWTG